MLIPYIVYQASPTDDDRNSNMDLSVGSCEQNSLHNDIIQNIVNIIYDFCSKEYGYNITITSYDDFCEKYWEIREIRIRGWYDVFEVRYFSNKWILWDINKYKETIFNEYMKKCKNK